MVQSPSLEANWFAASQEIPRISRNPKFITALTSVRHLSLSWASPIQSIYPHPTSRGSILKLSTHLCLGLPSGLLPSGFPTKTLYTLLSSPILATCPAHLILLDFITRTILGEEHKSFSSSLCNLGRQLYLLQFRGRVLREANSRLVSQPPPPLQNSKFNCHVYKRICQWSLPWPSTPQSENKVTFLIQSTQLLFIAKETPFVNNKTHMLRLLYQSHRRLKHYTVISRKILISHHFNSNVLVRFK